MAFGAPVTLEVLTIGHSNVPAARIVELLRQHAVALVVDVRGVPYSRHNPQFNRETWQRTLAKAGIAYVPMGDALGGLPGPDGLLAPERGEQWEQGLARLLELAAQQRTALLCAEEDPHRCHRGLLIAPALIERGVVVWHIRGDGRLERAEREEAARQLPLF